jgi:predicted nucleic acid-binding protein
MLLADPMPARPSHDVARQSIESIFSDVLGGTNLSPDATFAFCRFTQLGLLRLLTAGAVMSDEVMTQPQAWAAYDRWLKDPRVEFVDEPAEIETRFRALTRLRQPATKDWADSYLAAFATVGQLTLVTFDRGLRSKAKSAILLGE